MPVIAECSSCGSKLTVPDNLLGQEVKCPRCDTIQIVAASTAQKAVPVVRIQEVEPAEPDSYQGPRCPYCRYYGRPFIRQRVAVAG